MTLPVGMSFPDASRAAAAGNGADRTTAAHIMRILKEWFRDGMTQWKSSPKKNLAVSGASGLSREAHAVMEPTPSESLNFVLIGSYVVSLVFAARVIMRRIPVGTTLAWLSLIFLIPYVGAVLYVILGDIQLGRRRAERIAHLSVPVRAWLKDMAREYAADVSKLSGAAQMVQRQIYRNTGIPVVSGTEVGLLHDWQATLQQVIDEIDRAETWVLLEFYIWYPGGKTDEVLAAVVRARKRGVICRILVDSVGSRRFLRSRLSRAAREAGVEIVEALPAGFIKGLFQRQDIRMHRKIVVVDDRVAFTGSLNMADARQFKVKAGVGQWVDAMVKVEGVGVTLLKTIFIKDWIGETGESVDAAKETFLSETVPPRGRRLVQALPSGPGFFENTIYQTLLSVLYLARNQILLTTPYFVPDDSVESALIAAARRGVNVTLVVPAQIDSYLVKYASRSHFGDLLAAGVNVAEFNGGLLHTKTITVDDDLVLVGSVNLDQRSFWINFEVTFLVYDADFKDEMERLQRGYLKQSRYLDLERWRQRPVYQRFHENIVRLTSPLL